MADVSPAAEPMPIEFSRPPSSSEKLIGASGRDGLAAGLDALTGPEGEAANEFGPLLSLLMATGLPGLPFPTSPTILKTGGQVAVGVAVLDGVYEGVGVLAKLPASAPISVGEKLAR